MSGHPTGLPLGTGAEVCGGCAWRDPEGPCRFAGSGSSAGPAVVPDQVACAFFEPPPSCDPCGACCREAFDTVPVTEADAARLRPAHADLLRAHDDGWRDLARVPSTLGRGTRCAALRGDGSPAGPYRCVVYALRPSNCRDLAPGSEACLTARRRVGITPYAPGQAPDGPLSVE